MPHEIELKLAFPHAALSRIVRHPLVATAPKLNKAQTLVNTYYDTPDLDLHKARVAVRTRKAGQTWLQTVKCAAESIGGLSSRPEWEQKFSGTFDFSAVDEPATRKLLDKHAEAIGPLFTTEFRRDTRVFEPKSGVRILMMIDSGTIRAEDREEPISELELELESGAAEDLLDLAIQLAAELPLLPYDPSKAERGYRLFHKEEIAPLRAAKSPVQAEWTPLQAFRALAGQAQTAWQFNLYGAQQTADPDFVHQMRIALRRLRTMLRVFSPILPIDFVERWNTTFSDLADGVGEARDIAVLRATILEPARAEGDSAELTELVHRADAAIEAANSTAQPALASEAHAMPMLEFIKAQEGLDAIKSDETLVALVKFARDALRKIRKRVRARFETAKRKQTPEAFHRLRIAIKHLRYAAEFFSPLFKERTMKRFLKDAARLQDEFGFLNDLTVAQAKLGEWADNDPKLLEARAFVGGYHASHAAKLRRAVLVRADELLNGKSPWRAEAGRPRAGKQKDS